MCSKVTLFEDTKDPEAESLLFVANEVSKLAIDNKLTQTDVFCLTGITSRTHLTQLVYMRDAQTLMNALSDLSERYELKTNDLKAYKEQLDADYGPLAQAEADHG